jgi:hypothetical protein
MFQVVFVSCVLIGALSLFSDLFTFVDALEKFGLIKTSLFDDLTGLLVQHLILIVNSNANDVLNVNNVSWFCVW